MTLTDFLLARVAEDEGAAKAASPGPWRVDPAEPESVLAVDELQAADAFALSGPQTRATASHIARHDPARVLAECEAKRQIVAFMLDDHGATIDGEWGCCHSGDDLRNGGRAPEYEGDEFEPLPSDCPGAKAALDGLKLLALPYADHPDYDVEWKP